MLILTYNVALWFILAFITFYCHIQLPKWKSNGFITIVIDEIFCLSLLQPSI